MHEFWTPLNCSDTTEFSVHLVKTKDILQHEFQFLIHLRIGVSPAVYSSGKDVTSGSNQDINFPLNKHD